MSNPRPPVSRAVIDDFLARRELALVGVSRDGKTGFGNTVRKELGHKGYHFLVVHPSTAAIDGVPCYPDLTVVANRIEGLVLVTPPSATEALVRQAIELGIERIWLQPGAESDVAIDTAETAGVAVVHHQCILMYAEPVTSVHRAHRWLRGVAGRLPS